MDAHEVIVTFLSLVLSIILFVGLVILRHDYEVDSFRQEIFQLRDNLFDFAADGHIAFDDPAYRKLRNLMNGLIRFAHRLTFWRVLFLMAAGGLLGTKHNRMPLVELQTALENISDPNVKANMREFHRQVVKLIGWQFLRSTCLIWPVLLLVTLMQAIAAARNSIHLASSIRQTAESPAIQKNLPTSWIEDQAIACA